MTTFVFWNLKGNDKSSWAARRCQLQTHLVQIASSFDVDVFVFGESAFDPAQLIAALNKANAGLYCYPPNGSERIQIVTRFKKSALKPQYDSEDGRVTIRRLITPSREILLAAMHFQSQWNWSTEDQAFQATVLRENIIRTEDTVGHQRTILVGDMNMNPFHPGMVGAQALNAVMTRDLARVRERTVAKESYRLFYNPMWGHFGDRTPGPPGTYYYSASAPVTYYWNMFDQVLLRPELMDTLAEVRILDTDGRVSLLAANGKPRSADTTDHLPLLFRLDI